MHPDGAVTALDGCGVEEFILQVTQVPPATGDVSAAQ
jgi:hypothetical protein